MMVRLVVESNWSSWQLVIRVQYVCIYIYRLDLFMLGPKCVISIYIYVYICIYIYIRSILIWVQQFIFCACFFRPNFMVRHGDYRSSLVLARSFAASISPDVLRKSTPIMWGKTWYPLVIYHSHGKWPIYRWFTY